MQMEIIPLTFFDFKTIIGADVLPYSYSKPTAYSFFLTTSKQILFIFFSIGSMVSYDLLLKL
ncbi:hypothetical protein AGMMS49944_22140 [Spirochaetia bacterium]|nr:hypothetical protein AGMMS49944_22140 [Spirochaetia bacterium]